MAGNKSVPRSREKRVTSSNKTAYRRKEDSSPWYANPTRSGTTRGDVLLGQYRENPNAARDQRRWDATVTSKKVRGNASRARSGKKTK